MSTDDEALQWQVDIWDRMAALYTRDIEGRFVPVVTGVVQRASPQPGERGVDVGCGTGAATLRTARAVGASGRVVGVDISRDMLALARDAAANLGLGNVDFREGRAEAIPADDASADIVLASLSLMYVIDRAAAAREIARVLRPGGRFVAAVWGGPASCDIVLFQQAAASFAPAPPIRNVGPGALADPRAFLGQLEEAGIDADVHTEILGFDVDGFDSAWDALAGVTAAQLPPDRRETARAAVRTLMWPHGDGPRHFANATHFIAGRSRGTS